MSAQDQITSTFERFSAAWQANDGAAAAAFFVDDGSLINPFGERADGRAAIAGMYSQYFGGMLRGSTTSFTLDSVRDIENDHAFADGQQIVTGSDGKVILVVHIASLMRRGGDSWKIVDSRPYTFAARPA